MRDTDVLADQEEAQREARREVWRGFWEAALQLWPVLLLCWLGMTYAPQLDSFVARMVSHG